MARAAAFGEFLDGFVVRMLLIVLFQTLNTLPKQSSDNPDPLYRLFFREASIGRKLLDQVCKDLADVVKVCDGELKQTNHLRTLMSSLTKGSLSLPFASPLNTDVY
jgi:dynein heavy chain 1